MKINSIIPPNPIGQYEAIQKKEKIASAAVNGKDEVQLSGNAQSFAAAVKAVKTSLLESGTSSEQVHSIKQRIEDGSYDVSSKDIADRMLFSPWWK